jgi:hypothetical protein
LLSPGIALTCADAGRLIDLSSAFSHRSVIFLGDRARAATRIWPTAIIGLEPAAAVTESQRQLGYRFARLAPIAEYEL